MIKKINIEEIKKREEFLSNKLLTREEVEYALEEAKSIREKKYGISEWKVSVFCGIQFRTISVRKRRHVSDHGECRVDHRILDRADLADV